MNLLRVQSCYVSLCILSLLIFGLTPLTRANSVGLQEETDASVYNGKGVESFKSGKYEEAVKFYKQAIKLKKEYSEAYLNLGDAYFLVKQYKQSIEAYKDAIKYGLNSHAVYNKLGTAHFAIGEHSRAIDAYKKAIRLDPKISITYFNLGSTYVVRGNEKAALEQYKILKDLDAQLAHKLHVFIYKPLAPVLGADGIVRLNVIAIDGQGNPVSNLDQDDFQVLEDNIPQTITTFSKETYPLVYGLVLDTSGSMNAALEEAINVGKAIVNSNRPEDETILVRFVDSDKIETVLDFTSDKSSLQEGLDGLYVEAGQSAIIDAVYLAAQRLAQYKPENSTYLRRAIILITDGDERASYYTINNLVDLLRKIDIQIFAICLGKESAKSTQLNNKLVKNAVPLLTTLTNETGGQVFFPKSVAELTSVATQLLAASRTQYLIGYKPPAPGQPSTYRTLKVQVVDKAGRDRINSEARAGYTAVETTPVP